MPSDLVISQIIIPTPVTAPCPTPIEVEVVNQGSDAARLPFEVAIEFGDDAEGRFETRDRRDVFEPEGLLVPGQRVRVPFTVRFPCTPVFLRAVADPGAVVPNNLRTNPTLIVSVTPTNLVAWLSTDIRVGSAEPGGSVQYGVSKLCISRPLVVEATIRNLGCVDAPASQAELTLSYPGGQATSQAAQPVIAMGAAP